MLANYFQPAKAVLITSVNLSWIMKPEAMYPRAYVQSIVTNLLLFYNIILHEDGICIVLVTDLIFKPFLRSHLCFEEKICSKKFS